MVYNSSRIKITRTQLEAIMREQKSEVDVASLGARAIASVFSRDSALTTRKQNVNREPIADEQTGFCHMMEENRKLFSKFMALVGRITNEDYEVTRLLQRRFNKCDDSFLASHRFKKLINKTKSEIVSDVSNKYVFIKKFVDCLKENSKSEKRKSSENEKSHVKEPSSSVGTANNSKASHGKSHKRVHGENSSSSIAVETKKRKHERVSPETDNSPEAKRSRDKSQETKVARNVDTDKDNDKTDKDVTTKEIDPDPNKHCDKSAASSSLSVSTKRSKTSSHVTVNDDHDSAENSVVINDGLSDSEDSTNSKLKSHRASATLAHPKVSALKRPDSHKGRVSSDVSDTSSDIANSSVIYRKAKSRNDVTADVTESSDVVTQSDSEMGDRSCASTASKAEHQVARLEKLLEKLRDQIEQLEEAEVGVDDLDREDTDYLKLDKYKRRFVQVWKKLCAVKGRMATTGRPTERKFVYNGTRWAEINRKIEKLVNRFKTFPDFQDIRDIVKICNAKHYGGYLTKSRIDSLAKSIFTEVGNLLQERRQDDFVSTFGCSLTDNKGTKDPALHDKALRHKLNLNQQLAKSRLEAVINKYADRQDASDDSDSSEDGDNEADLDTEATADDDVILDLDDDVSVSRDVEEKEAVATKSDVESDINDDDSQDNDNEENENEEDEYDNEENENEDENEEESDDDNVIVDSGEESGNNSEPENTSRSGSKCNVKANQKERPAIMVPIVPLHRLEDLPANTSKHIHKENDLAPTTEQDRHMQVLGLKKALSDLKANIEKIASPRKNSILSSATSSLPDTEKDNNAPEHISTAQTSEQKTQAAEAKEQVSESPISDDEQMISTRFDLDLDIPSDNREYDPKPRTSDLDMEPGASDLHSNARDLYIQPGDLDPQVYMESVDDSVTLDELESLVPGSSFENNKFDDHVVLSIKDAGTDSFDWATTESEISETDALKETDQLKSHKATTKNKSKPEIQNVQHTSYEKQGTGQEKTAEEGKHVDKAEFPNSSEDNFEKMPHEIIESDGSSEDTNKDFTKQFRKVMGKPVRRVELISLPLSDTTTKVKKMQSDTDAKKKPTKLNIHHAETSASKAADNVLEGEKLAEKVKISEKEKSTREENSPEKEQNSKKEKGKLNAETENEYLSIKSPESEISILAVEGTTGLTIDFAKVKKLSENLKSTTHKVQSSENPQDETTVTINEDEKMPDENIPSVQTSPLSIEIKNSTEKEESINSTKAGSDTCKSMTHSEDSTGENDTDSETVSLEAVNVIKLLRSPTERATKAAKLKDVTTADVNACATHKLMTSSKDVQNKQLTSSKDEATNEQPVSSSETSDILERDSIKSPAKSITLSSKLAEKAKVSSLSAKQNDSSLENHTPTGSSLSSASQTPVLPTNQSDHSSTNQTPDSSTNQGHCFVANKSPGPADNQTASALEKQNLSPSVKQNSTSSAKKTPVGTHYTIVLGDSDSESATELKTPEKGTKRKMTEMKGIRNSQDIAELTPKKLKIEEQALKIVSEALSKLTGCHESTKPESINSIPANNADECQTAITETSDDKLAVTTDSFDSTDICEISRTVGDDLSKSSVISGKESTEDAKSSPKHAIDSKAQDIYLDREEKLRNNLREKSPADKTSEKTSVRENLENSSEQIGRKTITSDESDSSLEFKIAGVVGNFTSEKFKSLSTDMETKAPKTSNNPAKKHVGTENVEMKKNDETRNGSIHVDLTEASPVKMLGTPSDQAAIDSLMFASIVKKVCVHVQKQGPAPNRSVVHSKGMQRPVSKPTQGIQRMVMNDGQKTLPNFGSNVSQTLTQSSTKPTQSMSLTKNKTPTRKPNTQPMRPNPQLITNESSTSGFKVLGTITQSPLTGSQTVPNPKKYAEQVISNKVIPSSVSSKHFASESGKADAQIQRLVDRGRKIPQVARHVKNRDFHNLNNRVKSVPASTSNSSTSVLKKIPDSSTSQFDKNSPLHDRLSVLKKTYTSVPKNIAKEQQKSFNEGPLRTSTPIKHPIAFGNISPIKADKHTENRKQKTDELKSSSKTHVDGNYKIISPHDMGNMRQQISSLCKSVASKSQSNGPKCRNSISLDNNSSSHSSKFARTSSAGNRLYLPQAASVAKQSVVLNKRSDIPQRTGVPSNKGASALLPSSSIVQKKGPRTRTTPRNRQRVASSECIVLD